MNTAIVLAGGKGTRIRNAECPKQYIVVGGHPLIWYTLKTVISDCRIAQLVIVSDPAWYAEITEIIGSIAGKYGRSSMTVLFAAPGMNRQMSILNGLNEIEISDNGMASEDDLVAVIDGVRPNMTSELLDSCFDAAAGADGAMPVLPMKDTVYYTDGKGRITELIDRVRVYAGQAPEVFRFVKYLAANKALPTEKMLMINGSSEPAVMAGMEIRTVTGDEHNYKITTEADLERFRAECGEQ